MNEDAQTGAAGSESVSLSLIELATLAASGDPEFVFRRLGERGLKLELGGPWMPLSGGLEYNHYQTEFLSIDGLHAKLIAEVTRSSEGHNPWLNGFELRPPGTDAGDWTRKIRELLEQDFELESSDPSGVEVFTSDGLEQCLLFPEPPRLFIHGRTLIRNPS
jgi:hypothetical protein